jgi:hypothetical protein
VIALDERPPRTNHTPRSPVRRSARIAPRQTNRTTKSGSWSRPKGARLRATAARTAFVTALEERATKSYRAHSGKEGHGCPENPAPGGRPLGQRIALRSPRNAKDESHLAQMAGP